LYFKYAKFIHGHTSNYYNLFLSVAAAATKQCAVALPRKFSLAQRAYKLGK